MDPPLPSEDALLTAATAVTWVFAALLGVAGVAKVTRPAATGAALQTAKLPSRRGLVRALGAAEIALAAVVLGGGGALPAALLAATYAAFALFAWRQAQRGADCGCFGQAGGPTTRLHVAVNATGAVTAALAAGGGAPALGSASLAPAILLAAAILLVVAVALLRLTLTALPDLTAAQALHRPESAS